MAKIAYVRKTLNALAATDASSEDIISELPAGVVFKIQITQPRNVKFHRKFFALLKIILDNQSHFQNLDELLYAVKIRLGYSVPVQLKGMVGHMPKSISFSKMDEQAFSEFYERTLDFLITEVIPGLNKEDLEQELEGF